MKCTNGALSIGERPDGHDWVLVPNPQPSYTVMESNKLLWACPCDAFKWTSYAEWDRAHPIRDNTIVADSSPDATLKR